jgi:hypothetical protein
VLQALREKVGDLRSARLGELYVEEDDLAYLNSLSGVEAIEMTC